MTSDIPIEYLRNLGPTSAAWLEELGIDSKADLQRFGSVVAYRLVRQRRGRCSLNLLWALEGALTGTDWRELPVDTKERLRREAEEE